MLRKSKNFLWKFYELKKSLKLTNGRLSCSAHAVLDAGGLGFESRAGQIGQNVANGSPPLVRFFGAVLPRR